MIKDKYKGTMREALLSPKVYKWLKIISLVEFVLILICPWFKIFDFSIIILGFYLLDIMDILTTFFQRKNINSFICLILALIISFLIS